MKKRLICSVLALAMVLLLCTSALADTITPMMVSGGASALDNIGRTAYYSGHSRSPMNEDLISVTLTLQEYRSGSWYAVDSTTNTLQNANFVAASDSFYVTGGTHYRVSGTHVSNTKGVITTVTSTSPTIWIP